MDAISIAEIAAGALAIGFIAGSVSRGWLMAARNENLRRIERMRATLTDYHRWLDHEFPEVGRVLENLFIELTSRPMHGGEDVSSFRSISRLRDELRAMRNAGVEERPAMPPDVAKQFAFFRLLAADPACYKTRMGKLLDWITDRLDPAPKDGVALSEQARSQKLAAAGYTRRPANRRTPMHDPEDWGAARNVDHLEAALNEERRKFQQETLRTSELIQMLQRWMKRAHDQGCRADTGPKACDGCRLMTDTQELLDTPVNAGVKQE